jgi:acyl dehydratase
MALDRELVGRSYPPSAVYEVGRAKIAEFAAAIGEDDPVHRDADAARAAGHPDVIAPPTFAIVVSLEAAIVVLDDPEVALDYSRVVHGEQRFAHHRPIRAGDRLVADDDHRRGPQRGRQRPAHRPGSTSPPRTARRSAPRRRCWSPGGGMRLRADVDGRHRAPRAGLPGHPADLVRYAGASGDFNPIHWNERVATEVGLPGVIAHGMFTMALAGRAVTAGPATRGRRRLPRPLRPAGRRPR